jgi:hypothetical protein
MKRKRLIIIIFSFFAVTILGVLLWPREREPEYDGVPLSEWLERFDREKTSINTNGIWGASAAYDAIQQMGTNTLPFLVRWIQYDKPGWRQRLYDASWKLPRKIFFSRTYSRLITLGDKRHRADIAAQGFKILGRKAEAAVPELKRLAQRSPLDETSYRAMYCLEVIGAPKEHSVQ